MSLEENKEIIRLMVAQTNRGDVEASVEWTAPDCPLNGKPFGREGDRQRTMMLATAFPDGCYTLDDLIAEGDRVVARWAFSGTHAGPLASLELPPSGKQITFQGISVYRIADSRIVEIWESYDRFGLLQQLGVIPG